MTPRRIEVFFYGLFMDADLLRAKGADPVNIRSASVPRAFRATHFELGNGQRCFGFPMPAPSAW
jgi:hypothetical protein